MDSRLLTDGDNPVGGSKRRPFPFAERRDYISIGFEAPFVAFLRLLALLALSQPSVRIIQCDHGNKNDNGREPAPQNKVRRRLGNNPGFGFSTLVAVPSISHRVLLL